MNKRDGSRENKLYVSGLMWHGYIFTYGVVIRWYEDGDSIPYNSLKYHVYLVGTRLLFGVRINNLIDTFTPYLKMISMNMTLIMQYNTPELDTFIDV